MALCVACHLYMTVSNIHSRMMMVRGDGDGDHGGGQEVFVDLRALLDFPAFGRFLICKSHPVCRLN